MFFSELTDYYQNTSEEYQAILKNIMKIQNTQIDNSISKTKKNEDFISFSLYSKNDLHIPLTIEFGRNSSINRINLYLWDDIEILSYEDISSFDDLQGVAMTVKDMLEKEVYVEKIYVNKKLVRLFVKIHMSYLPIGEYESFGRKLEKYSFWQKKEIKEKKYDPWIPKVRGMPPQ